MIKELQWALSLRPLRLLLLSSLIVILYQIPSFDAAKSYVAHNLVAPRRESDEVVFTFTAAGDYGATSSTTATLRAIAASGASFNLALGDLSYDDQKPESNWCEYVKSHVGADFPFELVVGNHEDFNIVSSDGTGGSIDSFAACLPHRIENIAGIYPREYYFDYPFDNPIARFIAASPDLQFEDGYWKYLAGNSHYSFLRQAIDDARSAGIEWIILSMHKNCISVGALDCGLTPDMLDLILSKKIDLVLQSHDHNYQRSKQLALNPTSCPSLLVGAYNGGCVVNDGSTGVYKKGEGTLFLIVGTGGQSIQMINLADAELQYFVKYMGANVDPTFGFARIDVSASRLSVSFVPTAGGSFTDSFAIAGRR